MLSLVMLKTMKQLLQNLKLQKRKLRRSRKCSTLRQPMLISRRDRTFSRRAPTLSMDSLIPSMPIWLPCPSQFLRTRRKLLQRKLQLLRTSLRSMDVLPPQSRRLKILLLTSLLLTTDSWKDAATAELTDIKEASGAMLPEDRVARTMDLQEDIAAKLEILKGCAATEKALLPQGDKV